MNPIEFSQRLPQTEPGSPEAAALAAELVEDARHPAYLVLQRYLTTSAGPSQMKAKQVLADLRELSLVPLAESAPMKDVEAELWATRTMVEEFVDFRRRAASVLKDLLLNRRQAPAAHEGSVYLPVPGARVCDLAAILLHRLFHLELSPSSFLTMPLVDRDKRIKEFQHSRVLRSAFEKESS
jgi:hypothetical protein